MVDLIVIILVSFLAGIFVASKQFRKFLGF